MGDKAWHIGNIPAGASVSFIPNGIEICHKDGTVEHCRIDMDGNAVRVTKSSVTISPDFKITVKYS
jgi:hypothetical protein